MLDVLTDSKKQNWKGYVKHANRVKGLLRFTKIAYPDYIGAECQPDIIEPLLEKNRRACRAKVLQNLRVLLNEVVETEKNVVYDLDELIDRDNKISAPKELRNDDEFLIFTNQTTPDEMGPWGLQKRKHLIFESRFECGNLR